MPDLVLASLSEMFSHGSATALEMIMITVFTISRLCGINRVTKSLKLHFVPTIPETIIRNQKCF